MSIPSVDNKSTYFLQVAVPVPVDRPYAVPVPRPYPVTVEKHVAVPVDRPVPVPVPHAVPYPVVKQVSLILDTFRVQSIDAVPVPRRYP